MTMTQKPAILVVDDDPHILDLMASLLGSMDCDVVGRAEGGTQAVLLYRETGPDLVLLDFMMPGLSGLETLKQILEINPEAVVVMLTAVENNAVSDDCILAGAKDFIRKDLRPEELVKRLQDELGKIAAG
jgi:two-component system, chemotaxis family, chemotaxis protein CheY